MSVRIDPLYLGDQIVDKDGLITSRFRLLWQQIIDGFARTSATATKTLTGQHAAIVATVVTTLIAAGNYRLSYYLRKTIADGVASSAQVTLGFTDRGTALAEPFAALVTDSVTAHASGSILVRADAASNVTLDVAYASNTPGVMGFDLIVTVEPVQ
jgi:hypothetical protein